MKVLYIHQYFREPRQGGGLRSFYLARELVNNGFTVIMLTAHNDTTRIRRMVDGIDIIYLPVKYGNEMSFRRRSVAFLKFMILAMVESIRLRNVDLCYVMTTPLSTGIVALFNKLILRRPYIFEVGDLWPKVPIEMGLLKARWKQSLLTSLEKSFCRNAKGLVGLSVPITDHLITLAPGIPSQTVFNISDCKGFRPSPKEKDLVHKYDVKAQFVISYTGTFGLANDLSRVIDFAKSVEHLPIKFFMVGDGAEKEKIKAMVKQAGIRNIQFFDFMSKKKLQEIVNVSDAMLVSFAPFPSLYTGSPNKFFDALAAGKLVIINFNGWIGELIEKEECGFFADDPESFALKVKPFLEDPKLLHSFQSNARRLAEEKFDLKVQSQEQQKFIKELFS